MSDNKEKALNDELLARMDAKIPVEEARRLYREMEKIRQHKEAAANFCEGFDTAALEKVKLREVVEALKGNLPAEKHFALLATLTQEEQ